MLGFCTVSWSSSTVAPSFLECSCVQQGTPIVLIQHLLCRWQPARLSVLATASWRVVCGVGAVPESEAHWTQKSPEDLTSGVARASPSTHFGQPHAAWKSANSIGSTSVESGCYVWHGLVSQSRAVPQDSFLIFSFNNLILQLVKKKANFTISVQRRP